MMGILLNNSWCVSWTPFYNLSWRMFNLEIQKLQMFIAGNIWKKMQRFSEVSPSKIIPELIFSSAAINAVLCCVSLRASKPRSWVVPLGWEMGACNKAIWWEEWWFTRGFRENKPRYGYGMLWINTNKHNSGWTSIHSSYFDES